MELTFLRRMRQLLDNVLAQPKGSDARAQAEREWGQFIRQHYRQPDRASFRIVDTKARQAHDPDVEDYETRE